MRKRRQRPPQIVTEAAQAFSFSRRATLLGGAQIAVGGMLAARMAWISVAENEKYAVEHRDIVAKFGRFPHRNRTLGRESTPAERVFLLNHQGFGQ